MSVENCPDVKGIYAVYTMSLVVSFKATHKRIKYFWTVHTAVNYSNFEDKLKLPEPIAQIFSCHLR